MNYLELLCTGTIYPDGVGPEGIRCPARCTGQDDMCDNCRLYDAGANIQGLFSGFSGLFENIENMRKAGDAAGLAAVKTDLNNILQRMQYMQSDPFLHVELRAA